MTRKTEEALFKSIHHNDNRLRNKCFLWWSNIYWFLKKKILQNDILEIYLTCDFYLFSKKTVLSRYKISLNVSAVREGPMLVKNVIWRSSVQVYFCIFLHSWHSDLRNISGAKYIFEKKYNFQNRIFSVSFLYHSISTIKNNLSILFWLCSKFISAKSHSGKAIISIFKTEFS